MSGLVLIVLSLQVMWAFVRVKDPGSGLPKFVLINWVSSPGPSRKHQGQADLPTRD